MKILESPIIISCNNCGVISRFNPNKDIIIEEYYNFDFKSNKEVKYLREISYCPSCSKKIIISENMPDNKS